MLFANAQGIDAWLGPILASLMSFGTAFFAYLTTRDKLRYDAKMLGLEKDVDGLRCDLKQAEDSHAECRDEHAKLAAEVRELQKQLLSRPTNPRGKP